MKQSEYKTIVFKGRIYAISSKTDHAAYTNYEEGRQHGDYLKYDFYNDGIWTNTIINSLPRELKLILIDDLFFNDQKIIV